MPAGVELVPFKVFAPFSATVDGSRAAAVTCSQFQMGAANRIYSGSMRNFLLNSFFHTGWLQLTAM